MQLIISAAPVVITLFALGLGIKSLQAALLGVTVAAVGAVIAFPVPLTGLIPQLLHWLPILLEVLAIIAGGLLLSEVLRHAGVQTALASWIKTRAGGGVAAVLLVVHGITPFAESLTGFAIGITIGIPLLANFGLPPRKVAVLGLLGLCTIPWGSMGPGTMVAASLAELSFHDLGVVSGFVSFIPLIATGVTAAWLVSESGERVKAVLLGALSGVTLTVAITCFNMLFGTSPAGALGSLVIILLHFLRGSKTGRQPLPAIARKGLLSYFVLLVGVLAGGWYVRANGLSEAWRFLGSPALWLFVASQTAHQPQLGFVVAGRTGNWFVYYLRHGDGHIRHGCISGTSDFGYRLCLLANRSIRRRDGWFDYRFQCRGKLNVCHHSSCDCSFPGDQCAVVHGDA